MMKYVPASDDVNTVMGTANAPLGVVAVKPVTVGAVASPP
jgi:hypothetical protein